MSGNKAVDLQLQMRQNAEDLQSFMKDLDRWELEIREKDQQLRSGDAGDTPKTLPPVRNKDYKKTKKRVKRASNSGPKEQTQRIRSGDYQAWDRFDVEKALEVMDAEESPVQSNESDAEGGQLDGDLALAEKEKGTQFFRDGRYDSAIECYTRAMDADPHSPELPTLRAACFFSLRKFSVAESDCNLAIALDGRCVKAYARRGAARAALRKHQEAREDYEMVLKLDPENAEAQRELQKLQQECVSEPQVCVSEPQVCVSEPQVCVATSDPAEDPLQQQRLQEQLRKQEAVVQKDRGNAYFKEGQYEAAVQCYSRGMEADRSNALLPANRAMAYLRLHRYREAELDCSAAVALDSSYAKAFARRATARAALGRSKDARADFEQVLKLEPGNKQAMTEIQRLTEEMRPVEDTHRRTVQPVDKPEHLRSTKPLRRMDIQEVSPSATLQRSAVTSSPHHKIQKMEESTHTQTRSSSSALESIPPPPSNSFQLESDLRKTRSDPQSTYRYLRQISPDSYPRIFQNSLEPDVLNLMLQTFHRFYIQHEDVSLLLAVLRSLASVRRFDMAVMFMSTAEKKILQDLFDWILRAGLGDSSVQDLQKKYGL